MKQKPNTVRATMNSRSDRPGSGKRYYRFRLYVSGNSWRSTRAVRQVKALCEEYLKNSYALEVIDVFQQPQPARAAQIIATPTLVREQPKPLQRFVGEWPDPDRLAALLGLKPKPA